MRAPALFLDVSKRPGDPDAVKTASDIVAERDVLADQVAKVKAILADMKAKEMELWSGKPPRMGNGAIALMLDGFASRLAVAIGEAPPPRK